jgi:hypothetical protein
MRELKKELWPYRVAVKVGADPVNTDITAIEIWLGQQLGTFKGRWNVVYHYNQTYFYFRNSGDATLFALRWG